MHSFCHHCLTIWLTSSFDCPMCRDEFYLTVKNPLLDQFIDLFVDLSLTKEEKSERRNLIQQRLIPFPDAAEEDAELLRLVEQIAVRDPSVDTTLVTRNTCVLQARMILYQIFTSDQFKQLELDDDFDKDKLSVLEKLCFTLLDDMESLKSVLQSFPQSLKARYITFPLPS